MRVSSFKARVYGASVGLAVLFAMTLPAAAACTAGLPVQTSSVPSLAGRVVFQGSNADGSNAQIYLFDFANLTQTQVSQTSWNVTAPINAQFSPDGKRLTLTAVRSNRRDVYVWTFASATLVNLTGAMTGAIKSEDPKWSPDGKSIVIKQDGNIKLLALTFDGSGNPQVASLRALTTNGVTGTSTEASAPFVSPDNEYVYFVRGTGAAQSVKALTLATGAEVGFSANGTYAYYPVARDLTTVLYAGWTSATGRNDQVLLQAPVLLGDTSVVQPSLNDCGSDNSDPAGVDRDYILFASDSAVVSPAHIYRPVLGSLRQPQVWDLSRIGLGTGIAGPILGMSYSLAR